MSSARVAACDIDERIRAGGAPRNFFEDFHRDVFRVTTQARSRRIPPYQGVMPGGSGSQSPRSRARSTLRSIFCAMLRSWCGSRARL